MGEPKQSQRQPGRSFENPTLPLGSEMFARTSAAFVRFGADGAAASAAFAASEHAVADRARAIGVLRKAEEFMRQELPAPTSAVRVRRAFELAADHAGVRLAEYESIVRHDPELAELEERVLAEARLPK